MVIIGLPSRQRATASAATVSGLALVRVEAAIFANPPEMHGDKKDRDQGQNHAVQHVKTQQRVGVHQLPPSIRK